MPDPAPSLRSDRPAGYIPDSESQDSPQARAQRIGGLLLAGDWRSAAASLLDAKTRDLHRSLGYTWDAWLSEIPISRAHAHRLVKIAENGGLNDTTSLRKAYRATVRETERVTSVVYFIRAEVGGPIKIGQAVEPKTRLRECQAGCPIKLVVIATMPGGREKEAELHAHFAAYRLHGEWFRPVAGLLKIIRECRDDPIPAAHDSNDPDIIASDAHWARPA